MRDKFGLEFRIVDSELLKTMRRTRGLHVNPWKHFPRLITSIDFLKRDRPLRLFREALPASHESAFPRRFDVLVVDEAHNVAPAGRGNFAIDSLRTAAVRMLAPHFEHKLFLSATPHNGYTESFTALLELIDNQRFIRGTDPAPAQLEAVMVRRLKSELPERWDGTARFAKRVLQHLEVDYTAEEREIHRVLRTYTKQRQENSSTPIERTATEFVLKLLKKRLFSSPAAFARTLALHRESIKTAKRRTGSVPQPHSSVLLKEIDRVDEEFDSDHEADLAAEEAVRSTTLLFQPLTAEQEQLVTRMQAWADRSTNQLDSKARTLLAFLRSTLKPGGNWTTERVIIFTEYRDTQKWLLSVLAAEGFTQGDRLMMLYGGMDSKEREKIKAAFQHDPAESPVRILLVTDAASEGIDLQNYCHRLIHYEIPWNPARLEQRNGRVDRHGQRAPEVLIKHFVAKGFHRESDAILTPGELDGDLEFLMRAALKVEQIREDLGKVGPVIADQVEEAMLGRRVVLDTKKAESDAQPVRRLMKFERNLREQVKKLAEQLQHSKQELRLDPENIHRVVEVALTLAGQPPLIPVELPNPSKSGVVTRAFRMPPFRGSWSLCAEGLEHPHTRAIRPVVFDHNVAATRDDVVLAHLNHRLVRMSLSLLRAEVWSSDENRSLHRVSARLVPDIALREPALVGYARLIVLGGRGHRLHEELITVGGTLREGRLQRMKQGELQHALDSGLSTEPSQTVKDRFVQLWPRNSASLRQALEVRSKERIESLTKVLDERSAQEQANIQSILQELERSIRKELDDPDHLQLEMFTQPEKEQALRNMDFLRGRLTEIPQEIVRETQAVRDRYAHIEPRIFPVAVVWLVPERLKRG